MSAGGTALSDRQHKLAELGERYVRILSVCLLRTTLFAGALVVLYFTSRHSFLFPSSQRRSAVDAVKALSESRLFRELSGIARQIELPAHATLFTEGDTGDELYVILMGTMKVLKRDDHSGQDEEIALLGTGSYLGEMSLVISDEQRSATVVSSEPTYLLAISREGINKLTSGDTALGRDVYRALAAALASRLRNTSDDAAHFKAMVRSRRG